MAAEEPLLRSEVGRAQEGVPSSTSDANDLFSRSVPVPKNVVGGVIGSGGVGLRALEQKTGLTVNMSGNKGPHPILRFSQASREEDLDAAEAVLLKLIEELQSDHKQHGSRGNMFELEPLCWLESGKKWSWVWGQPYSEEVAILAKKRGHHKKTNTTMCAGPAVLIAMKTLFLVWGFWVFFAVLSLCVTHCNEEGFAEYPLYLYAFFLVMLAVALRWEGQCLSYVTVPCLQHIGRPFEIMGIRMSYGWWRFMMLGLSCTAHADLATNTLFWAKQITTDSHCQEGAKFVAVWDDLIQSGAAFWGLPANTSFSVFVTIAWLLMGLQAIQGLVLAIPIGVESPDHYDVYDWPRKDHYTVGDELTRNEKGQKVSLVVKTLLSKSKDHGGALMSLAAASRMTSVGANSESYMKSRYQAWRDSPEGIQLTGTGREERAVGYLRSAFTMWLEKYFFLALLDCMVQLNIQVFCVSVHRALYGSADPQALFSLGMGFLMSVKTMLEAATIPKWIFKEAFGQGKAIIEEAGQNHTLEQPAYRRSVACSVWKLKWVHAPLYVVIYGCYVVLFCYSMRMFTMMFVCDFHGEAHMVWAPGLGCVDVSYLVH